MQPRSFLAKQTISLFFFLTTFDYSRWVKSPVDTDGKRPSLSLNDTPCPNVLLSSDFPPQAANAGCQDSDRLYLICNPVSITLPPSLPCPLRQRIVRVAEKYENNPAQSLLLR